VLDAYFDDWMCILMGGERLARWELQDLELKDTKYTQEFSTQYICIYLRS
jgi:hypothetical protein